MNWRDLISEPYSIRAFTFTFSNIQSVRNKETELLKYLTEKKTLMPVYLLRHG